MSVLPQAFTPKFLKQLERRQISTRKNFLGRKQGGHYSLKKGHGIEFADYRKYQLGDDPRHIDWNLQARSERTYIKRFREEQDLMVHLIIDNSLSMSVGDSSGNQETSSKWERVKELALSIAYLVSMQHDVLQISTVGKLSGKKYAGNQLIYKLASDLNDLPFYEGDNFFDELKKTCQSVKYPGIAYFISDFLVDPESLFDFLNFLISKNIDLKLLQVLSSTEIKPKIGASTCIDLETKEKINLNLNENQLTEYLSILRQHQESIRAYSASRQISWKSFSTDEDLLNCVCEAL